MKIVCYFSCSVVISLCLTSCVATPPHDGLAKVPVDEVIKRIKCEIAKAVIDKTNQKSADGKHYPFTFLLDWAAKLHFTVAVDNTGSINPGATLIRVLPASQSESIGIGVGFQAQAQRQEEFEYLMSFSELKTEFNKPGRGALYNYCQFEPGLLLESELGLKGLVDAALKPVETEVLSSGRDVGPGAAPAAQGKLPDPAGQLKALTESRANRKNGLFVDEFFRSGNEATDIEARTQSIINNIVKPMYGIASTSNFEASCLAKVTFNQNRAIIWSVGVSANTIKFTQSDSKDAAALSAVKSDFTNTVNATTDLINSYDLCAKNARKKDKPKSYDPISTIAETVNFYVTTSGSVTPTWKLVNVSAPLAGNFASASRKDTNSVILTMGRPVTTPDGGITASDAMNNQILAAQLSQAISQRPAP